MSYENVATVTQIVALLFFVALFLGVVAYAFWPGNKKAFDEAANIPLDSDPDEKRDE